MNYVDEAKATAAPLPKKNFFSEIVGLRIYLALWVAVGHGLQLSGFLDRSNPIMNILLDGHAAVALFMIVSGFVITNLLLVKQEPYPRYITRRFFRLFPAYLLCCVIGYILTDNWVEIVRNASWASVDGWDRYAKSVIELDYETTANMVPHLLAHLVMLHGLIPVEILNRAAMTFLPAAWSISLEWQFYLVAPFVIGALGYPRRLLMISIAALLALLAYKAGLFGHYNIGASLLGATGWFAVGIASRLAVDPLSRFRISPLLPCVIGALILLMIGGDLLPMAIWMVFYSFMIWRGNAPVLGRIFAFFTTTPLFMLLGEASYSLYLIHRPVQVWLGSIAVMEYDVGRLGMLAVQIGSIVIALLLSIAIYYWVEKPGIAFGRKLADSLPGKGAIKQAETVTV